MERQSKNEDIMKKTGLRKLELVIKERRLNEVAGTRIKNGGLQNTSSGYAVGTEGLQEEIGTAKEKLDGHCQTLSLSLGDMGITWDEAEELATDRAEWRQRVAQCIYLDAG